MKLPIVILHGWRASSQSWQIPKKLLEEAGYQVFTPDLPGFGQEPPPKIPWSVNDYVEFVLRFSQEKGLTKFILIGHSFGGRVSLKLAAQYPGRVGKLILIGSPVRRFNSFFERLKISLFFVASKISNLVFSLPFLELFKPTVRKLFYFLNGSYDYAKIENEKTRETFRKVVNEDLTPLLEKIKTETLLLWGENDKVVPLAQAKYLQTKIENSKLVIIANGRHAFPYKDAQPEVFVKNVLEFLE